MEIDLQQEIEFARALAIHAHGDQKDKGGKLYINHPLRVANAVPAFAQPAAWLHDVVEDTRVGISAIVQLFSPETAHAVHLLTRDPRDEYKQYVALIKSASGQAGEIARLVKIADVEDNFSPVRHFPGWESLGKRYEWTLEFLRT